MEQLGQVERFRSLQRQGEVLFGQIAPQLNRLQPGRERTREEFEQVCVGLALFVHHLLDSDGEEPAANGWQEAMMRKTEVYRGDRWVETPFRELAVGDVFRLWEPVVEHDENFGDVVAWKCDGLPEERDGTLGCECRPAMTLPVPSPTDQVGEESTDQ